MLLLHEAQLVLRAATHCATRNVQKLESFRLVHTALIRVRVAGQKAPVIDKAIGIVGKQPVDERVVADSEVKRNVCRPTCNGICRAL